MFYLLGSGKPLLESLQPNPVDQKQALENQFKGRSDVPFEYADFENTLIGNFYFLLKVETQNGLNAVPVV